MTLKEIEAAFADLARRKRVTDRYPRAKNLTEVRLKDGAGSRRAASKGSLYYYDDDLGYRPTFRFPRWSRNRWVVLHEAAHWMVSHGVEAHGWQYAECLLWLYRQVGGLAAAEALEAAYKKHRVKYRKPRAKRQLTPEQRQAAIERLALARAARAAKPKPHDPDAGLYVVVRGDRVCAVCRDFYHPCPVHIPERAHEVEVG